VIIADLDMQNFFNTVEWPAIRDALRQHWPQASPLVEWEQTRPSESMLSDLSRFAVSRGSEQGETLGSTKAALPLGTARGRVASDDAFQRGVYDARFIDDGVVACEPHLFDTWLKRLDMELANIGVTRGEGPDIKSTARLVCQPGDEANFAGWGYRLCPSNLQSSRDEQCLRIPWHDHRWSPRSWCILSGSRHEAFEEASVNYEIAQPCSGTYPHKEMCGCCLHYALAPLLRGSDHRENRR
jgi:hypothetical protein